MRAKIFVSLSILLIFGTCSSPEGPDIPIPMMMIHIEGVVIDVTTNRPIEGARITVYRFAFEGFKVYFRVATNHEGYYSIHEPFPREECGGYKLGFMKAEKIGYKAFEYSTWADPFYGPRCTEDLQRIDFQLEPDYVYDIPVLLSPEEGAVLDNGRTDGKDWLIWEFDWTDVYGATHYYLQVIGPSPNCLKIDEVIWVSSYIVKNYGAYIANKDRFDWKWKVRAYVNGVWSDCSEERSFDVEPVNTDSPSDV